MIKTTTLYKAEYIKKYISKLRRNSAHDRGYIKAEHIFLDIPLFFYTFCYTFFYFKAYSCP